MLKRFYKLISHIYFPIIQRPKRLKMGFMVHISNVTFGYNNYIGSYSTIVHSSLGDYCYMNKRCQISYTVMGRFCSIADDVKIGLGFHPTDLISTHPAFYSKNEKLNFFSKITVVEEYKKTTIGNDVWVGSNAIILGGLSIGDGAIVAAGAVVTRDVDPYAIVGGNPARVIKYRFEPDTINKLLKMKWWDSDLDLIKKQHDKFLDSKVFFQTFSSRNND